MAAIELVRDPHTREPAPEVTDRVVALARERGVLLIKAGLHGNVVRILAPLVIDDALLDHALDTLAGVIADATK
jgi:4-aminobutyrate aminotransferase/(S)-3-amino-2-methylpropionate transaminase